MCYLNGQLNLSHIFAAVIVFVVIVVAVTVVVVIVVAMIFLVAVIVLVAVIFAIYSLMTAEDTIEIFIKGL